MKLKLSELLLILLFVYSPAVAQTASAQLQYSSSGLWPALFSGGSAFRLDNVFKDKTIGFEFNFVRLFFNDAFKSYSGTVSVFNVEKNSELAFPMYYLKGKNPEDISEFTIDCHFRHFLNGQKNGFYVSAFTRFANMEGTLNDNLKVKGATNKLGFGLGIGFRKFTESGFYMGISLSYGKFFFGKNDIFNKVKPPLLLDDDAPIIRDIEAFKIGWAF